MESLKKFAVEQTVPSFILYIELCYINVEFIDYLLIKNVLLCDFN